MNTMPLRRVSSGCDNRKAIVVMILAAAIALLVAIVDPRPSIAAGAAPAAFFPFDGSAADASGNGNDGQLINGADFGVDRFGHASGALALNGSNQYVRV